MDRNGGSTARFCTAAGGTRGSNPCLEQGALAASAAAAALLRREVRGYGGAVTVSGLHAVSGLNLAIMVDLPGMIRPFSGPKQAVWGPANFECTAVATERGCSWRR